MNTFVFVTIILAFSSSSLEANGRSTRQVIFPEDEDEKTISQDYPSSQLNVERCLTPDRTLGSCIKITDCPSLFNEEDLQRVRKSMCGYRGIEPKVCCPRSISETQKPNTVKPVTQKPSITTNRFVGSNRPTQSAKLQDDENLRRLPENCGRHYATAVKVVGGREAVIGSWPWMVALYREVRGIKITECGGSLISQTHVITAAHCVIEDNGKVSNPSHFTARLGDHDLTSYEDVLNHKDIPVFSITVHEHYESKTFKNDIALLKLSSSVNFTSNIQPICLPYYNRLRNEDLTGKMPWIAGWGDTKFEGDTSNKLLEAQVRVWSQNECRKAYQNKFRLTREYLCANDVGVDSCQGDSGGPLMLFGTGHRFYQIGIVSSGHSCAEPEYPGIYTNLKLYLNWINANL